MAEKKKKLRVFLCHASDDLSRAEELYLYLRRRGIRPWLDSKDLMPGQDWKVEIPEAITSSDAIIVCLSKMSVDKEGYVQKEIAFALDKALEMPGGRIFLIPARFEECEVPESLNRYHWVNLFEADGHTKLMNALRRRASQLRRTDVEVPSQPTPEKSNPEAKNQGPTGSEFMTQALDLACLAMSAGRYSLRANVFTKCDEDQHRICIKYHSTNMEGAADLGIQLERWQGCAGQSWGYNAPVVADMTLPELEGGSKWGLTSEQLEVTKDLSAILSLPIRHPDNRESTIGILSFDSTEPIAEILKADEQKRTALAEASLMGLLLLSFGESDPL
jgi:hypothetical protein